jgi:hypothetical protein
MFTSRNIIRAAKMSGAIRLNSSIKQVGIVGLVSNILVFE